MSSDNSHLLLPAFNLMLERGTTEHFVARYVMIMLLSIFKTTYWIFVPQYKTINNMVPDLVLERFKRGEFVRNVFIELKSNQNKTPAAAIDQLLRSITKESMNKASFTGYLIGIQGRKWIFMEYLFYFDNKFEIGCLPFNYNHDALINKVGRPEVREGEFEKQEDLHLGKGFELDADYDQEDIISILNWISKGKRPRNISQFFATSTTAPYPRNASDSTLGTIPSSRDTSSNFIRLPPSSPIPPDIGSRDLLGYDGNPFTSKEQFPAESLLLLSQEEDDTEQTRSPGMMNLLERI